jgi:hypothetical protein
VFRRLAALAVCLCPLPALAACGGSGEEGQVKATVDELYAGFAERDADKVCDTLTEGRRRDLAKGVAGSRARRCEEVMGFALGYVGDALKDAKKAMVTEVELAGDKAKATVEYRGKAGDLGLAKVGGDWKVSDFDLDKL